MEYLFYISLALIVYTYFGYPVLLGIAALVAKKPVKKAAMEPKVSIFVSAYNEEKNIEARVRNLLDLDYPRSKLEIIVGSDGSTDETYQIIKRLSEQENIRYAVSFQRIGKSAMLNKMAKDAQGEIFVFADARQRFDKAVLRELVHCFADSDVGAVSGELIIEDQSTGTGKGMGLYWSYEKMIRKMESAIGSTMGATGAIYAIRREFFSYLPDIILDDMYIPMNAILSGKRVIFEPGAKAYDIVSGTTKKEFSRKVRTLAGNFEIFALLPEMFNPFRSKIAFQLFSHKFLRLLVPYFLSAVFVSNLFLMKNGNIFVLAFFLQVVFYSLALLGYLLEKTSAAVSGILRILLIPYEFCALNFAAVAGLWVNFSGKAKVAWEK